MPVQKTISLLRGETHVESFLAHDPATGALVNLTDALLYFSMRSQLGSSTAVLAKDSTGGMVVAADQVVNRGSCTLTIDHADTVGLSPTSYWYDAWAITIAGVYIPLVAPSQIIVNQIVTSTPLFPVVPAGTRNVMPLGDSITAGSNSTDGSGYRGPLLHLAHLAGKPMTYLGTALSGPSTLDGLAFPRGNEGYPGDIIQGPSPHAGLYELIDVAGPTNDLFDFSPLTDIVLLMIGVNDVSLNNDLPNFGVRYAALVDRIHGRQPLAKIVCSTILPTWGAAGGLNLGIIAANDLIPPIVAARSAYCSLVDPWPTFSANPHYGDLWLGADGVHPTDAGYAILAGVWWTKLKNL